jgi:small GTP-binding protein
MANQVKINFWDVAGEDEYYDIRNEFYKDTNGAFLVFDVSDKESFDNLKKWIKEFREFASDDICLVVVGNKIDKDRVVSKADGIQVARELNAKYWLIDLGTLRRLVCLEKM